MSNQLLIEQYRVLDANGFPIPGALLYTYVPGTTTPRTVYTDSGLTTAASNPVVADASGTFVPLYTEQPVKINVTTSEGASVPGYPRDHAVLGIDPDDFSVQALEVTGALSAGSAQVGGSDVYTKGNAIGAVAYSSGNTGAIFENGGTIFIAGGFYTKFANGWFAIIASVTSSASATTAFTFPFGLAAESTDYSVSGTVVKSGAARILTHNTRAVSSFNFDIWTDAGARAAEDATLIIVGRWRT